MQTIKVWDPVVRIFHWGTALLFFANTFALDGEGAPHRYAGYAVFALVLIRLVWGLIGTRYARFSAFRPSFAEIRQHLKTIVAREPQVHLSHNPLGAVMVYNLLTALLLISITGIMADSDAFWGVEWVEELHEGLANYALICVGFHVVGVLFESHRSHVNLLKAMLIGRKDIPEAGA